MKPAELPLEEVSPPLGETASSASTSAKVPAPRKEGVGATEQSKHSHHQSNHLIQFR